MEAVAVIGALASITGLIDAIGRTLFGLHDIYKKFKDANTKMAMLIAELSTTKAALAQIHTLIERRCMEDEEQYFQLTIDLESSLTACSNLIHVLDSRIVSLGSVDETSTYSSFQRKVETVLSDAETTSYLGMLSRQITVLNLLVTTFTCQTTDQQRVVLQNKDNRQLFNQVKDDNISLRVLYDSASFSTAKTKTTTSSKLSKRFPGLDDQLFETEVYQNSIRALMRFKSKIQASREEKKHESDLRWIERSHAQASSAIDRRLEADAAQQRKTFQLLFVGPRIDSTSVLRRLLEATGSTYSHEERIEYRDFILQFVVRSMQNLVEASLLEAEAIELEEALQPFVECILAEAPYLQKNHLSATVARAIQEVWLVLKEKTFIIQTWEKSFLFDHAACYFFEEVEKLLRPDYVPSQEDIAVILPVQQGTLTKIQLSFRNFSCEVIHSTDWTYPKKWVPYCENVTSIIFVVDLCCYDQYGLEDPEQGLEDRLTLFERMVNSRWLYRSASILILDNWSAFKTKLMASPMSDTFPEYLGGQNAEAAANFVLDLFKQRNLSSLPLYSFVSDVIDSTLLEKVMVAVKQQALGLALYDRGMGLLPREGVVGEK